LSHGCRTPPSSKTSGCRNYRFAACKVFIHPRSTVSQSSFCARQQRKRVQANLHDSQTSCEYVVGPPPAMPNPRLWEMGASPENGQNALGLCAAAREDNRPKVQEPQKLCLVVHSAANGGKARSRNEWQYYVRCWPSTVGAGGHRKSRVGTRGDLGRCARAEKEFLQHSAQPQAEHSQMSNRFMSNRFFDRGCTRWVSRSCAWHTEQDGSHRTTASRMNVLMSIVTVCSESFLWNSVDNPVGDLLRWCRAEQVVLHHHARPQAEDSMAGELTGNAPGRASTACTTSHMSACRGCRCRTTTD